MCLITTLDIEIFDTMKNVFCNRILSSLLLKALS